MTTFSRMQKLAGLKEYEEFNPDDFQDFDSMDQDLKDLGYEHIRPDTTFKVTLYESWFLQENNTYVDFDLECNIQGVFTAHELGFAAVGQTDEEWENGIEDPDWKAACAKGPSAVIDFLDMYDSEIATFISGYLDPDSYVTKQYPHDIKVNVQLVRMEASNGEEITFSNPNITPEDVGLNLNAKTFREFYIKHKGFPNGGTTGDIDYELTDSSLTIELVKL